MKQYLASLMLVLLVAFVGPSYAQNNPSANDTAEKKRKYDKAKEDGKGILDKLLTDVLSTSEQIKRLPPGSNVPAPGEMPRNVNDKMGADDLGMALCYDAVYYGTIVGAELVNLCGDIVMKPQDVMPGATALTADLNLALCADLIRLQRAPNTPLEKHCMRTVAANESIKKQLKERETALAGTNTGVNVSDRSRPDVTETDLTNAYSACTVQNEAVGSAKTTEEVCTSERVITTGMACSKRLTTRVSWACPAGTVLSGPTRVTAATATADGRYTCQMQEPREVYSCPAGTTGPSMLPIPPGNQSGQACRNTATSAVTAATRTTVMDTVTRDATHSESDTWAGNCDGMESNTPPAYRSVTMLGAWAGFDSSPNSQRCRAKTSTCTDVAAGPRIVNDALVTRSCWAASESFDCASAEAQSDCDPNPKCTEKAGTDTCETWDEFSSPRTCLTRSVTRTCTVGNAATRQVNNCENQTFCLNGMCNDVGHTRDKDFDVVVSILNAGAEAGRYFAANDFEVFKGYPGSCRHIYGGTVDCCKKNGWRDFFLGGFFLLSNFKINTAEEKKNGDAGKEAQTDDTRDEHNKKMTDENQNTQFYTQENLRLVAAHMRAVNTAKKAAKDIWKDIKDGDKGAVVWDFVWKMPREIGHQIWNTLLDAVTWVMTFGGVFDQCEEHEQMLIKKKDKDLCLAIGSRCIEEFFGIGGTCWQRQYNFCCFPSLLGKLINEGGRTQLKALETQTGDKEFGRTLFDGQDGMWGSKKNPNCTGFTLDQFRKIKLNLIDLGPFIASISPKLPSKDAFQAAALQMMKGCAGGSAQCDNGTPYVSPIVAQGKADGTNAGVVTADQADGEVDKETDPRAQPEKRQTLTARDKAILNEKQFISIRPLLLQAFNTGYATGTVNNEDIKLFSKWRFRKDNAPTTVTINAATDGAERVPGKTCKYLTVKMTRPAVDSSWTDTNVWDEKLKIWRPPGHLPSSDGKKWVASAALQGEVPLTHTQHFDAWEQTSVVNFCSDGTTSYVTN